MCKRFSFKTSVEKMEQQFNLQVSSDLRWSYNIAPTQHAYVLLNSAPNRIQYITWGLIPANSRDGKNEGKLINARKEGIAVSPSFRMPIRSRRCLVLADSFYCFQKMNGEDTAYRITIEKGDLMTLAGVWDIWYNGDYAVKSFSIITKPASGNLKGICERMPVIIRADKRSEWLSEIPLSKVQSIVDSKDIHTLYSYYEVSPAVLSIQNNDKTLHDPKTISL